MLSYVKYALAYLTSDFYLRKPQLLDSCCQGKLNEALLLYEKSLAIRQQVYGDDHPKVAVAMNNIALLYKKQVLSQYSITPRPLQLSNT